jgi:hypothetical protein
MKDFASGSSFAELSGTIAYRRWAMDDPPLHNDASFREDMLRVPQPVIGIRMRLSILLSGVLLIVAVLLVFHGELQARDPHRFGQPIEPVTQCGYWNDMSAGMSCRWFCCRRLAATERPRAGRDLTATIRLVALRIAATFTQLNLLPETTLMGGSMKTDRDVMELAHGKLSVEQIATALKITPKTVIKTGLRLGIYFPPLLKRNGWRTTKWETGHGNWPEAKMRNRASLPANRAASWVSENPQTWTLSPE